MYHDLSDRTRGPFCSAFFHPNCVTATVLWASVLNRIPRSYDHTVLNMWLVSEELTLWFAAATYPGFAAPDMVRNSTSGTSAVDGKPDKENIFGAEMKV
ncbi:hypothetical protein Tco_0300100 [Tanacetum coccineum]